MPIEDLIFSGGGGFLFGILAGYAIKKGMKIASIIIGLFVVAYLSRKEREHSFCYPSMSIADATLPSFEICLLS